MTKERFHSCIEQQWKGGEGTRLPRCKCIDFVFNFWKWLFLELWVNTILPSYWNTASLSGWKDLVYIFTPSKGRRRLCRNFSGLYTFLTILPKRGLNSGPYRHSCFLLTWSTTQGKGFVWHLELFLPRWPSFYHKWCLIKRYLTRICEIMFEH